MSKAKATSDYYAEESEAARTGRIGADRMALGLPCIPDPERGDMDAVARLVELVEAVRPLMAECENRGSPTLATFLAAGMAFSTYLAARDAKGAVKP